MKSAFFFFGSTLWSLHGVSSRGIHTVTFSKFDSSYEEYKASDILSQELHPVTNHQINHEDYIDQTLTAVFYIFHASHRLFRCWFIMTGSTR